MVTFVQGLRHASLFHQSHLDSRALDSKALPKAVNTKARASKERLQKAANKINGVHSYVVKDLELGVGNININIAPA